MEALVYTYNDTPTGSLFLFMLQPWTEPGRLLDGVFVTFLVDSGFLHCPFFGCKSHSQHPLYNVRMPNIVSSLQTQKSGIRTLVQVAPWSSDS